MNSIASGTRKLSFSQRQSIYQRQCQELQGPKYIEVIPLLKVCQIIKKEELQFHCQIISCVNQITDLISVKHKQFAKLIAIVHQPEKSHWKGKFSLVGIFIGDDLSNGLSLESELDLYKTYWISYRGSLPDNVLNALKCIRL